jgi:hypothetical protein
MKGHHISALLLVGMLPGSLFAQENLGVAQYSEAGELLRPANLAEWIQAGASLGSDYGQGPFDAQNPGAIGVVQMEPSAWRYFLEHKTYADGTMFLLSFYGAEGQSSPQLPGFVQGTMRAQEIHVIDKARFGDDRGHAFFLFPTPETASSTRVPVGNDCVACHTSEGKFDGTFIQFYPHLRTQIGME